MNRLAVALAADSATTVTYWENGRRQQRYFKGANKIFNLSASHPVGLMTYDSGTLQGVPWEVATKSYREARGSAGHDHLADYPKDFFKYLSSKQLFSAAYQEKHVVRGVCETAGNIAGSILFRRDEIKNEQDAAKKKQLAGAVFAEIVKEVQSAPYLTDDCKKLAADIGKIHLPKIATEFKGGGLAGFIGPSLDVDALLALSVSAFLKARWTDLERTGLVFAGYGKKELFPCLEQYEFWGVVCGTVIQKRLADECKAIDFDQGSEIVAVAQDDMVNTFVYGASLSALVSMGNNFTSSMEELLDDLRRDGHLDPAVNVDTLKQKADKAYRERTKEYIWEQHATPLRRVVGMLPVDELALLAETFVSIELLKERVTRHTELVSGPIDVAVITKGDGFIWIKRKHYFDPNLNIRFIARKHEEAKE